SSFVGPRAVGDGRKRKRAECENSPALRPPLRCVARRRRRRPSPVARCPVLPRTRRRTKANVPGSSRRRLVELGRVNVRARSVDGDGADVRAVEDVLYRNDWRQLRPTERGRSAEAKIEYREAGGRGGVRVVRPHLAFRQSLRDEVTSLEVDGRASL